ncbi:ribosomal RNA small subunit methyltransferase A [Candidatus Micrarchaeota archaeon]|jgi:16S rRNA (adenine1518-N6/adenine1519-N6)-dimethyltransferase|nr:ribosomal RNA small subunit methyltransferase A [Candidatus Micrarchaeota archaeon]
MKKNKKLGQIFVNSKILKKEIKLVDINNKIVLEIGAGDGRLTELLSEKAKKVIGVEKDKKFCDLLKQKFQKKKNVLILCGDFLKFPPREVDIIIGNVPYYISSDILLHLRKFKFNTAVLMFQKEFVLKLIETERSTKYGFLSFISQMYFNINTKFIVDKSNFNPKPKVDSIVIILEKKEINIDFKTEEIIRYLFNHKKKTLKNALLDSCYDIKISKKCIEEQIQEIENRDKRVFKLTNEEILSISKKVQEWKKKCSLIGEKKKENC